MRRGACHRCLSRCIERFVDAWVWGFGIQYWGESYTAAALAAAPHCVLILEASIRGADQPPTYREEMFSRADVELIQRAGTRPVFAYLNVSVLAPYRDYWVDAFGNETDPEGLPAGELPVWYGGRNESGEYRAAFWRPEWERVLQREIDAFLDRGFDGVFLDDVLKYYFWAGEPVSARVAALPDTPTDLAGYAQHMMALVSRLGTYAREQAKGARADFVTIVNGGVFIGWDAASAGGAPVARHEAFDDYVSMIDAIALEGALGGLVDASTIAELQSGYADKGIDVLAISYKSRHPEFSPNEFQAIVRKQALEYGFVPYIASDKSFDRLDPPILDAHELAKGASSDCLPAESPSSASGRQSE